MAVKETMQGASIDNESSQSEHFDIIEDEDPFQNLWNQTEESETSNTLGSDPAFDDESIAILAQTKDTEDHGDPLSSSVAESLEKIPNLSMTAEKLDELKKKYKVPANCQILGVPKINEEIWSALPKDIKLQDARLQASQQHLSRAFTAQARSMDLLIANKQQIPKDVYQALLQNLMDASLSVGSTVRDMNNTRKHNIRPVIQPQYAALCSNRLPVTTKLFGDNLDQSLKLVRSMSNVVRSQTVTRTRFAPYTRKPAATSTTGHLNYRQPLQNRGGQHFSKYPRHYGQRKSQGQTFPKQQQ